MHDFTCKTWIYFLNEKSEAFAMFRHFKAHVKKESGEYITSLRINRGGEFISNEFEEFFKVQDISRQLKTIYTHQQNEVVKRKNRTTINMMHSMLAVK